MKIPTETELISWIDKETPLGELVYTGVFLDSEGIGWGLEHFRSLEFYSFCLLLEGSGRYLDKNGYDALLKPGDCIWAPPGVTHKYGCEPGDNWTEVYFCFKGQAFDKWCDSSLMGNKPVRHLKDIDLWAPRFFSIARSRPRTRSEAMMVLSQIHLLLNDITAVEHHNWTFEERLEASKQQLLSWPTNKQPDWELLSTECSCSYETWRKAFKKTYGVSPAKFRREKLMRQAARLMTRSSLSNEQLAEQFGCSDGFHFSKLFKSVMGMSPRDYHKKIRQS